MKYDMDEMTILIHDLWQARQVIEDAQYRAQILMLRDKEAYERTNAELDDIWERLDDLRAELMGDE